MMKWYLFDASNQLLGYAEGDGNTFRICDNKEKTVAQVSSNITLVNAVRILILAKEGGMFSR